MHPHLELIINIVIFVTSNSIISIRTWHTKSPTAEMFEMIWMLDRLHRIRRQVLLQPLDRHQTRHQLLHKQCAF